MNRRSAADNFRQLLLALHLTVRSSRDTRPSRCASTATSPTFFGAAVTAAPAD
jgi:hypothetical protein